MEAAMGLITWVIFGAIAGWLASKIVGRDDQMGCLTNIVVGVAGAFLGGAIVGLFTGGFSIAFNLTSFIVAILGAVLLLAVVNLVFGRRRA
jgi:uncharacterized membrane protein YeaQ/YmgE (transglycosylase-associated protein family)